MQAPEIRFVRIENSREKDNRGWTYDAIEAFLGEEKLGWVTISYIPREVFNATYPTILHWNWVCKGCCYSSKEDRTAPFENWTYEELCIFIKGISWHDGCRIPDMPETKENCLTFLRQKAKTYKKLIGKHYDAWINYHVDKPEPSYVFVHESQRGQGIGKRLYVEAARWMQERHLSFYASTLQTDEARTMWASLVANNMTERDEDGRHYIKYE